MRLLDYLKTNDITDDQFAASLGGGVSARSVKKWKYLETTPRLPELLRIERATNGEVTPRDFLKPSETFEQAMEAAQ